MADDRIRSNRWLVLDPSVELEHATAVEAVSGPDNAVHHCAERAFIDLYNHWLGSVIVAPASQLLGELLDALREPAAIDELRDAFGASAVDQIASKLAARGFAHVHDAAPVDAATVTALRDEWLVAHRADFRNTIEVDLDAGDGELPALASASGHDLLLRCRRAADHGAALRRIHDARRAGELRTASLSLACDESPGPEVCELLLGCGATLQLRGTAWPTPALALPAGLVATRIEIVVPWSELTVEHAERCIAWATAARVSGLVVVPRASERAADLAAVDAALRSLEHALGDVAVVGLPGDDVVVGQRLAPPFGRPEPWFGELLRRHLRRRVAAIRDLENVVGPPPSSEGDATLIAPAVDLVPRDPSLLNLRAGATVVDVCCSAGRTSRRLSAAVAPDGLIIGIDREPLLLEIGRAINQREGYPLLQARRGLAQRLPFPDASVDAVVCDWAFNMLLSAGVADAALREMVRILRPGGRLAVMQVLARFELADIANAHLFGAGRDLVAELEAGFERCAGSTRVVMRELWAAEERSAGRPARWYLPAHLPRLVDPAEHAQFAPGRRGLLCYSVVAERLHGRASSATIRSSDV